MIPCRHLPIFVHDGLRFVSFTDVHSRLETASPICRLFQLNTASLQIRPDKTTPPGPRPAETNVVILTKSNRRVCLPQSRPVPILEPETMKVAQETAGALEGCYLARPRKLGLPSALTELPVENRNQSSRSTRMPASMELDSLCGYFWGAMVGDGYVSRRNASTWTIGFCNSDDAVSEAVTNFVLRMGGPRPSIHDNPHHFDGCPSFSRKLHWTFSNLGEFIARSIGEGAGNKHLPPFWVFGNEEFRVGLLAGLLDTDGSISVSNGKDRPQPMVNYATTSRVLAEEVALLCASLEVRANARVHAGRQKNEYCVTISTPDVQAFADELPIRHSAKRENLEFLAGHHHETEFANSSRGDVVPISPLLADQMRKSLGAPRDAPMWHKSIYSNLSQAIDRGHINRKTLMDWRDSKYWSEICREANHLLTCRLNRLLQARDVLWDEVVEVGVPDDPRNRCQTAIPGSIPGKTMLGNGLIV